jgi:hypothetical protein
MNKNNIFTKKLKKLLLTVNQQIESFFNYFKNFRTLKIKKNLSKIRFDKKITISAGLTVFLIINFLLIPVYYDEGLIKIHLKNQILKKYNLEVKLEEPINYNFFPKPHFYSKNIKIIYDENEIAKSDKVKIDIKINNFFSLENISIKDLLFKQTEFSINANNFSFFKKILNSNKDEEKIVFINSKLFYKDQNEEIIFFSNIRNLNFFYNKDFSQELNAKIIIYNIPFNLNITNNIGEKKSYTKIKSHKLRLDIENNSSYESKKIDGSLDLKFISKNKKINYFTDNNSLNFNIDKENIKGRIDFKPFYLKTDIKLKKLDIKKIFKNDSLFLNLFNSEILNNQSLNAHINIYSDSITGVNYLNNIALKIFFDQGNISIENSKIIWKNSVIINLDSVQLISENNKMILAGSINFEFNDINDFYKQYQIKKTYRKKVEKINLDFLYDLYENKVELDNLIIDGNSSKKINSFMNQFNTNKKDVLKKVVFKNLIKEFFRNL